MYFLGFNRLLWAKYIEQKSPYDKKVQRTKNYLCWLMPKILSYTSPIVILDKGVSYEINGEIAFGLIPATTTVFI